MLCVAAVFTFGTNNFLLANDEDIESINEPAQQTEEVVVEETPTIEEAPIIEEKQDIKIENKDEKKFSKNTKSVEVIQIKGNLGYNTIKYQGITFTIQGNHYEGNGNGALVKDTLKDVFDGNGELLGQLSVHIHGGGNDSAGANYNYWFGDGDFVPVVVEEEEEPIIEDEPTIEEEEEPVIEEEEPIIEEEEEPTIEEEEPTIEEEPVIEEEEEPTIEEPTYTIIIHYIDKDGNTLHEDYIGIYKEGELFFIETPTIEGYIAEINNVFSGKDGMPPTNLEYNILYNQIEEEIIEENIEGAPTTADNNNIIPAKKPNINNTHVVAKIQNMGTEDEPQYALTEIGNSETPLSNNILDKHCCILHLILILAAFILLVIYIIDDRKQQKKIFDLREELMSIEE